MQTSSERKKKKIHVKLPTTFPGTSVSILYSRLIHRIIAMSVTLCTSPLRTSHVYKAGSKVAACFWSYVASGLSLSFPRGHANACVGVCVTQDASTRGRAGSDGMRFSDGATAAALPLYGVVRKVPCGVCYKAIVRCESFRLISRAFGCFIC